MRNEKHVVEMYECWECVCVGLQYVWEYRSPSKTVAPHYQCRLCKVQQRQNEMASHVTGWKHCFKYLVRLIDALSSFPPSLLGFDKTCSRAIRVFSVIWWTETCSRGKSASWRRGSNKEPSYQKGNEITCCWGGEDWRQRSNQGRNQWVYICIMT